MVERWIEVALAKTERDALSWAADAANDYWRDKEERADEGNCGFDIDVIELTPTGARIVGDNAVLSDIRYRLMEQLPEMAEAEPIDDMSVKRDLKAAYNAWRKINAAVPLPRRREINDQEG